MCLDEYRHLARALNTPPMFADLLTLIVRPNEVNILLLLAEREMSTDELSKLLKIPLNEVEQKVKSLFFKGLLKRRREGRVVYYTRSFRSIIDRYLSEGRGEVFGKYATALAEYLMEDHVNRARSNPYPGSRVLPIPEAAIEPVSIVLPYENAVDILKRAKSISIRDCECRVTYRNCDKPLRTCLGLNEFSQELVDRGVAEEISFQEAKDVLSIANESGLVHQALYSDWVRGEVFDICSCCPCCCTYLRTLLRHGVKHRVAKSGFVAKVNEEKCIGCGNCVNRCVFQARIIGNGKVKVVEENCYGCGLCTTSCPTGAAVLVFS